MKYYSWHFLCCLVCVSTIVSDFIKMNIKFMEQDVKLLQLFKLISPAANVQLSVASLPLHTSPFPAVSHCPN